MNWHGIAWVLVLVVIWLSIFLVVFWAQGLSYAVP
jgi:hypothetical protein